MTWQKLLSNAACTWDGIQFRHCARQAELLTVKSLAMALWQQNHNLIFESLVQNITEPSLNTCSRSMFSAYTQSGLILFGTSNVNTPELHPSLVVYVTKHSFGSASLFLFNSSQIRGRGKHPIKCFLKVPLLNSSSLLAALLAAVLMFFI